jgi:hypothetical protein
MRVFVIWCEGFFYEDETCDIDIEAEYHGAIPARSFQEACDTRFASEPTYEPKTLTLNGRRLFNSEQDARLANG